MPKFTVQETHPGGRPVFIYSIIDDDINALASAIMEEQGRGYLRAELNGQSDSIEPDETEKWLRKGAQVSMSIWYGMGRATITFRNTMRLAIEAESREEADNIAMVDYEASDEDETAEPDSAEASESRVFTGNTARQLKVEKFKELLVSRGLVEESALSGADVFVELESENPLTFKFMLPTSVKHADIMEIPCSWASDFGTDSGEVQFGQDSYYHISYSVAQE